MTYNLACKKCGLSFYGKGIYCGKCEPKLNKNLFSLTKRGRGR